MKHRASLAALLLLAQCGSDPKPLTCTSTANPVNGTTLTAPTGTNVMTLSINGTGCNAYANEPCVSVTLCIPSTTTCQTIDNVLLDTGSFGLRVFKSLLTTATLTAISQSGGSLAECVLYADTSSEWGEVARADIKLGGLTASNVPVHLINSTYATPPQDCSSPSSIPDTSPSEAGFNGILGIGAFQYDCGSACSLSSNNGQYYVCTGSTCSGASASLSVQVQNPAAVLPSDNNGLVIELPSVPNSGLPSTSGYLLLGVGTRSNNSPSVSAVIPLDGYGNFQTIFPNGDSSPISGFLDTGTSFLLFPRPSADDLPYGSGTAGGEDLSQLYCPSGAKAYEASNGSGSCVPFTIADAASLLGVGNWVFDDIGASLGTISGFDFGLPFFFGRNVVVGFDQKSSSLGTGPLVAY